MGRAQDLIRNAISNNVVNAENYSDAMFALRFLLHRKEFCAYYMDDCEPLLLLIGKSVVWPYQIARSVVSALNAAKDGDAGTRDEDASDVNIAPLLKDRASWTTYSSIIARWYT
ncbi:MAG: hypothetical protein KA032_03565, partial [Bifidobacterium sp.]|nr:hypothetical protein [Bifidobacterium sp.]